MYAERLGRINPFRVMELVERAKELEAAGYQVVHFEVGEPDFPTAEPIIAAGLRALQSGHTKYTQSLGIPELRECVAQYYGSLGVSVGAEQVVITPGASGALLLLIGLLLDPGDRLLLTDPGYPCNEAFVHLVNAEPSRIPLSPGHGFQLAPADLEQYWQPSSRGLLLASPANPTGVALERRNLQALMDATARRDGWLILDEIYQGLVYDDSVSYRTGLEMSRNVFVLNSFSKYFGMTGWRLGWMVVPESALDGVARLAQNLFISPPTVAQHAALEAFSPAAMAIHEARRRAFQGRRDRLLQGLADLGFGVPVVPNGAFYLYVDVSNCGMDSHEFCWRLINEYQVAVTPGMDFGENLAERYVRFAYTTDDLSIDLGLERIGNALRHWGIA